MQGLLEQADSLRQAGDFLAAEGLYRQQVAAAPDDARAHFQHGNVLCRLHRYGEAAEAFARVTELRPELAVAHFNLGNALCELNRHEGAVAAYRRALELSPEPDADAAYNLAKTLVDLGRWDEAVPYYQLAIAAAPQFFQAVSNLGQLYFAMRRPQDALPLHRQALEIEPDHAAEHYMLGRSYAALGRFDEAAASFRRVLRLNPLSGASYQMLGQILHGQGKSAEVAAVLADWRKALPGDPRCEHMQAAWLGGPSAARAADDYVRTLFDSFAEDFDETLKRLEYRAPELVAAAVGRLYAPRGELELLDAGCGTGLCGPLLRPYARALAGVDLSGGMLAHARERAIYDELLEAELTAHLHSHRERYDAILSADTLCYFGDLSELLSAARNALRPGGHLIFTVEHLDDETTEPYALHSHGRYAHKEAYLRQCLLQAEFTLVDLRPEILRNEGVTQVAGLLVVARK